MKPFVGPRSKCICGHTGDVDLLSNPEAEVSDHGGLSGHGPCKACKCRKFTWGGHLLKFLRWMKGGK